MFDCKENFGRNVEVDKLLNEDLKGISYYNKLIQQVKYKHSFIGIRLLQVLI